MPGILTDLTLNFLVFSGICNFDIFRIILTKFRKQDEVNSYKCMTAIQSFGYNLK